MFEDGGEFRISDKELGRGSKVPGRDKADEPVELRELMEFVEVAEDGELELEVPEWLVPEW